MQKLGITRNNFSLVKILGGIDLDRPITITADKFSASAAAAIERAGGRAILTSVQSQKE
jgi:ribosomal protein L15